MAGALNLLERPVADEIYMVAGWRQWADAGSVSSELPEYLIDHLGARKIGEIRPDGFYLFQIPGTHDLVRPMVKFDDGFPELLDTPSNDLYYAGDEHRGLVIFLGDEPHMDVERYIGTLLDAANELKVRRLIGFGGVYGEMPYDQERLISCVYSLQDMKDEMLGLSVNLSDYQGGASIGSVLCKRAGDRGLEYVGLYAFVPNYTFAAAGQNGSGLRIETDYTAWLNLLRRVSFMLKLDLDLSDLESKSEQLIVWMEEKLEELERESPQLDVQEYLSRIREDFSEMPFNPADEFWEEELRNLFNKLGEDDD